MVILLRLMQEIKPYKQFTGGEKMKEAYKKPVTDVQTFTTVDVISTSAGGDEPIVTPPDWD